jgi:integrase/recombinase XerD
LGPGQRLPRYLTQIELRAFFRAIRSLRDRTLFALIYHYGLRVGEVALLQRGDVDLERGRIVIKRLKGGAWTEQPLFSATARLLRRYLCRWRGLPDSPLFQGRRGPLRKRQIQSLFAQYRESAGLDRRYTCHGLRHSIATHLLDAGVALEFVQDHLGHQSIRSTSIYARITDRHRSLLFRQLERSPWIVQPTPSSAPWRNGTTAITA